MSASDVRGSLPTRLIIAFYEAIRDSWFVALAMVAVVRLVHFPAVHVCVAYLMVLISVTCNKLPEYRVRIEWLVGVTGVILTIALWALRGFANVQDVIGVAFIVGGTFIGLRVQSLYIRYRARIDRVRLPDEQ